MEQLLIFLASIVITVAFALVFRFLTLWYFRINEIVELQQQQLEAIETLIKKLARIETKIDDRASQGSKEIQ